MPCGGGKYTLYTVHASLFYTKELNHNLGKRGGIDIVLQVPYYKSQTKERMILRLHSSKLFIFFLLYSMLYNSSISTYFYLLFHLFYVLLLFFFLSLSLIQSFFFFDFLKDSFSQTLVHSRIILMYYCIDIYILLEIL